jgi:hypothetical protein
MSENFELDDEPDEPTDLELRLSLTQQTLFLTVLNSCLDLRQIRNVLVCIYVQYKNWVEKNPELQAEQIQTETGFHSESEEEVLTMADEIVAHAHLEEGDWLNYIIGKSLDSKDETNHPKRP